MVSASLIEAKKPLSNAAMYGNYLARKLDQYVEGKSMFRLCSREKCLGSPF